jgi:hypothetical protein
MARSQKATKIPMASGAVLRDSVSLAELTTTWKTDPSYRDEEGFPRVLELRGSKGTFEALAGQFFPKRSLDFVVSLACQRADVTAMKSGRIALLGSTVINTNVANSTSLALAHLIRQVYQLASTATYNHDVARGEKGDRRFERMCHEVIARSQFDILMQELRPQLHDLLERAESLLRQKETSKCSRRELCVANIGIYVSKCEEPERMGYDTRRMSKRARKENGRIVGNPNRLNRLL